MSTHRRRFLRLCGVAGLGAVAGCSGGSEEGETTADDATPADVETTTVATSSREQQVKLAADDGTSEDRFGISVAMSSDATTALIGAWGNDDPNGEDAGSAYVFEYSGGSWTQQAKLAADDGDGDDSFGGSVALSNDGTTALIGADADEDPNGERAGSAYVFENSGGSWSQQAKLAADDGDSDDQFGLAVALSSNGTTALIGAYGDSNSTGSAYIFENSESSWSQQAKLAADDGDSRDQLGRQVELSADGTTALIGSQTDDSNGENAGAAYVFEDSGGSWTQQAKLTADDGDRGDAFGVSVTMSSDGTTALIGASSDEDPNGETQYGLGAGSAYVFDNSGGSWSQRAKLAADDGDGGDAFGVSVTMSSDGSTALIGASVDEDPNGERAGSAYVFEHSGGSWTQRSKLVADDGESYDNFGDPVAMSRDGTIGLIGAPFFGSFDDSGSESPGSAYVLKL